MPRRHRQQSRKLIMPEINLTPLIDTALTLLVIFMVTTPMVQNAIKINLPEGKSKEITEQQEFIVSINKDNSLYFNSYPVEQKDLVNTVQTALKDYPDSPVFVRADESVAYGSVLKTVDTLKFAGVKSVGMSMRPHTA